MLVIRRQRLGARGGAWLLMGTFCTALAGALLGAFFLPPWREERRLDSWTETTCVVQSSGTRSVGSRPSTLRLEVRYTYDIEGRAHHSDRWALWHRVGAHSRRHLWHLETTWPAGSRQPCWVDPLDPTNAVLDRSRPDRVVQHAGWLAALGGAGLAMLGIGLWRRRSQGRRRGVSPI